MAIKFATEDGTKVFTKNNVQFKAHRYERGVYTLSLYYYSAKETRYGVEIGWHFVDTIYRKGNPYFTLAQVREEIEKTVHL